jgi:Bacterial PH domain
VLTTEVPGGRTERTWRSPLTARIGLAVCLGVITALPGLLLALTLVTNQVPDGGWLALALALAIWGLFAWRALAQSVTLTPDTLVIRNILATERVPLSDVTGVGFRRGRLTVTFAHGTAASKWLAVGAVNLGSSRWSGLRCNADAIAEAISGAAGLPPLLPRGETISRNWAWIMFLAAALFVGLGVYCGPLRSGNTGLPFALREVGAVLYVAGAGMLGLAFRIIRDHRRKRTRQAASSMGHEN